MTSNHEILGSTPRNCFIQSLDKVFAPLGPAHMGTQEKLPPISSHGLVVKRMTSNHEILGSTPSF
ncbi:hypothetical protein N7501_006373 [Penicillium viridicatum]|nr:hypothetical protein N7501_006373 [Penicillium viridicatum]